MLLFVGDVVGRKWVFFVFLVGKFDGDFFIVVLLFVIVGVKIIVVGIGSLFDCL